MKKMKKTSLRSAITVALTAGMLLSAAPAFATSGGYLGDPILSPYTGTAPTAPTFTATLTTTSNTTSQINVTPTSSYGNTFAPVGSGIATVSAAPPISDYSYNPSTLDLTQVAPALISNYTVNDSLGSFSGKLISNVFAVGSGNSMSGATPGELVFTYQFDVTSATPSYTGASQASISFFNNPNGTIYTLGDGFNVDSSGNLITLGTNICSSCTYTNFVGLTGETQLDPSNGSIASVQYQETGTVGLNQITPQIFVASNADAYTFGTMSVQGFGSSSGPLSVYVPGTPEPGTLVLFGTALGLTAFMVVRKRRNQMVA